MSAPGSRNPERDRRILDLAPNHSASEIAMMIGGGLTRNAVIGVCARANVKVNGGPSRKIVNPATAFPNWKGGVGAREAAPKPPLSSRKCQYPHGDPRKPGFHFCGKPVCGADSPYCAEHHAACYVKDPTRQVAA